MLQIMHPRRVSFLENTKLENFIKMVTKKLISKSKTDYFIIYENFNTTTLINVDCAWRILYSIESSPPNS